MPESSTTQLGATEIVVYLIVKWIVVEIFAQSRADLAQASLLTCSIPLHRLRWAESQMADQVLQNPHLILDYK